MLRCHTALFAREEVFNRCTASVLNYPSFYTGSHPLGFRAAHWLLIVSCCTEVVWLGHMAHRVVRWTTCSLVLCWVLCSCMWGCIIDFAVNAFINKHSVGLERDAASACFIFQAFTCRGNPMTEMPSPSKAQLRDNHCNNHSERTPPMWLLKLFRNRTHMSPHTHH